MTSQYTGVSLKYTCANVAIHQYDNLFCNPKFGMWKNEKNVEAYKEEMGIDF